MRRKILGLVLAPTAAAAIGSLFFGLKNESIEIAISAFTFFAVGGYLGAILIVLPALHFFERLHWINLRALALLGIGSSFLLTAAASLVFPGGRGGISWAQGLINLCSITLPIGLVAGVCFWFIVRTRGTSHESRSDAIEP